MCATTHLSRRRNRRNGRRSVISAIIQSSIPPCLSVTLSALLFRGEQKEWRKLKWRPPLSISQSDRLCLSLLPSVTSNLFRVHTHPEINFISQLRLRRTGAAAKTVRPSFVRNLARSENEVVNEMGPNDGATRHINAVAARLPSQSLPCATTEAARPFF